MQSSGQEEGDPDDGRGRQPEAGVDSWEFFLSKMRSHLKERMARYDLHFGTITLAAVWRVECGA